LFQNSGSLYSRLFNIQLDKLTAKNDMGNYKDLEYKFVERTLLLIAQYESTLHKFDFKEQYNYTLLINCLTGLRGDYAF
jgi:hypothetical protein